MNSKFDIFLENDDRYKLFIYQAFLKQSKGITIGELKEQIEISDFKLNQLLSELDTDLLGLKSKISIDNKFVQGKNFSSIDYQVLQLAYFKQSLSIDFLIKVGLFESMTKAEFVETHFISEATIYNVQSGVNDLLDEFGLKFKKFQIVGDESNIRNFYFQLLFNYFGGIASPFPKRVEEIVDKTIEMICSQSSVNLTMIQMNQLSVFLGIQFYRIKNECYVKSKNLKMKKESILINVFDSEFSLRSIPQAESEYLQLYLIINEYIDANYDFPSTKLDEKIIQHLDKRLKVSQMDCYQEMHKKIIYISQKWKLFSATTMTFISEVQVDFFKQSYPFIHEIIYDLVSNLSKINGYKISGLSKNYLYYELMFCLLSFDEIQKSEVSIKIFVDFSGGENYNKFISENIKYFRYLNVQLVSYMSDDVDLYISDFSNLQFTGHQLIWQSPPLDSDWENFANLVVSLKGRENNEQ